MMSRSILVSLLRRSVSQMSPYICRNTHLHVSDRYFLRTCSRSSCSLSSGLLGFWESFESSWSPCSLKRPIQLSLTFDLCGGAVVSELGALRPPVHQEVDDCGCHRGCRKESETSPK
ncbi:hypothetical protein F7725_008868 [Dissostichus mawsoni]|uniref:Uncharacterized protein n=1 Tax=Dissostichus mawsoni TaxID=36200 RepID=A0A7J5Z7D7_DISMA|nr:hypothetical protein F7725_008868 [Dissostichus mawsoni]